MFQATTGALLILTLFSYFCNYYNYYNYYNCYNDDLLLRLLLLLQGVLDALMCVGHLLASAAIPGLFLRDFMFISILKLVTFCVFEMRLIGA